MEDPRAVTSQTGPDMIEANPDIARALHSERPVMRFPENAAGRDFVVGDVHGMFTALREVLDAAEFNPERDRVFSVGDLVDRGPESSETLEWLQQPWFFACRGNHEQFALDSEDPEQLQLWVEHNGGEWWLAVDEPTRRQFLSAFRSMPLAMEVETASGRIGIVHADVPPLMSWSAFAALLESGDEDASFYAMWSRNRVAGVVSSLPVRGGVERVYCGHTPTRDLVVVDNVYYIDTGAVYCNDGYADARLTLVEVHPEPHREYTVYTHGG
jgi:serine/threonine protein phosphatase 1